MTLLDAIADKKNRLDRLRPLSAEALSKLEHYYDLEITYTSNAIEGNTLSPVETTLVIEQGVTIGGKPLKDHLEALDHYDAIRYVRELAREKTPLTESDVRNLHRLVVQRSRPDIAGRYADLARYVRTETGRYDFPRRQKFRHSWATSLNGWRRRIRPRPRLRRIAGWSTSTRLTTATDAPRGF